MNLLALLYLTFTHLFITKVIESAFKLLILVRLTPHLVRTWMNQLALIHTFTTLVTDMSQMTGFELTWLTLWFQWIAQIIRIGITELCFLISYASFCSVARTYLLLLQVHGLLNSTKKSNRTSLVLAFLLQWLDKFALKSWPSKFTSVASPLT